MIKFLETQNNQYENSSNFIKLQLNKQIYKKIGLINSQSWAGALRNQESGELE